MRKATTAGTGAFGWLAAAIHAAAGVLASVAVAARTARRASEVEPLLRLDDARLARLGRTRAGLVDWVFEGVAR